MPPALELVDWDALDGATFGIVQARIDWDDGTHSTGWGRDADAETAKWKAIGEAVERRGYLRPREGLLASAHCLDGFIDPGLLVRYTPEQHAEPDFPFAPFDPTEERYWLQASPVRGGPPTWVLADCICSPRAFAASYRGRLVTHATTSGCASAHSPDVAILRATLELVERDAFMRHWFAQRPGRAIAPESLPARPRGRLAHLARAGCRVGLASLTEGAHPTWLAWAQHEALHFTSIGTASGLDGDVALDTALNELETQALARLEGAGWQPIDAAAARTPADHAALYATPQYFRRADALLRGRAPACSYREACAGFEATPTLFHERLERAGHPSYGVDLSVEEALGAVDGRSVYVVRAVVPGLIPMAFGWRRMPLGMDAWRRSDPDTLHPFS